ncbi:hypothetical protein HBI24_091110 [Parastagonospora nodorum]|nr:hypothetical protein HBH43_133400 [Parastagonospora nodorum]KAH4848785.1 hypothetical protein HBH75_150910 [Parastagonospora nodorum]KAH5584799.1 hypothetical protein HBI24_091110 [Parastagonospora nodorum]KAH6114706.1 hypothetical protein HBI64_201200 [Parastagonospora nodorum]KAH6536789.1 hypothetical protein HBI81_061310 [Parastagonospora nodorum]
MTLNLPILSATGPGKPRPNIDAPFKTARMCRVTPSSPIALAYVVIYAGGTNTAQSSTNIAAMVSTNRASLNPRQSSVTLARELRGKRVFKSMTPSRKQHALSSAKHRIVHANPIRTTRLLNMIGYKTPPKPPAVVARPVARPRLDSNQWPSAAMLDVQRMEEDKPPRHPKDSMNW